MVPSAETGKKGVYNMRNRTGKTRIVEVVKNEPQISYQMAEEVTEAPSEESKVTYIVVKDTDFGQVRRDTFSIKVKGQKKNETTGKMEDVVLYENDKEPFEYDFCSSLSNVLKHSGAKLTDDQVNFLATALKSEDTEVDKTIGEAVSKLQRIYNSKVKSDAKSSAYQSLVNKHKPLEGEDREVAIAKTIRGFVKLSGISVETAIEVLKSKNAVPSDYTVEDYNSTKMRKTKGDDDEE